MAYQKFKAEQLFTGEELKENLVLVLDEKNKVVDVIAPDSAGDDVQTMTGILSPAFVNCHCHLELSHMKGLVPESTGLMEFVSHIMRLRQFPLEEINEAIVKADQEMYENGIAAVGDICNTSHTMITKAQSKMLYCNFVEVAGFLPEQASARFAYGEKLKNEFEKIGYAAIVPHAPYSVSKELFGKINEAAAGQTITIHNQESRYENLFYQYKKGAFLNLYKNMQANIDFFQPLGKTSIQTYLPELDRPQQILLVHNTFTSEEDIAFAEKLASLHQQKLYWTLCPNANWYIEHQMPCIEQLRNAHATICLGTDSIASNYQLSILAEMQRIRFNFPEIAISELLTWATENGAKALDLSHQYGSFQKGMQPGVIQIAKDLSDIKRIV